VREHKGKEGPERFGGVAPRAPVRVRAARPCVRLHTTGHCAHWDGNSEHGPRRRWTRPVDLSAPAVRSSTMRGPTGHRDLTMDAFFPRERAPADPKQTAIPISRATQFDDPDITQYVECIYSTHRI